MYQFLDDLPEETAVAAPALKLSLPLEPLEIEVESAIVPSEISEIIRQDSNTQKGELVRKNHKKERKIISLSSGQLMGGGLCAAFVYLLAKYPEFTGMGLLTVALAVAYPKLKKQKRRGGWVLSFLAAAGVATNAALTVEAFAPPAHAIFFQNAEDFLNTTFTLSTDGVTTLFNVLRAAYVIYLIYSAVMIWTAMQGHDDWMSVAKAPVITFIGGEMTDTVAGLITA